MPADEALLRRVADELALRNLVGRIAQSSDMGTLEEYGDCWTEDAVMEFPNAPQKGRSNLMAAAKARRDVGQGGPASNSRHLISTVVVRCDGGDQATVDSYMQWWRSIDTSPELMIMGHYHDTVRREGDTWRVAHRVVTLR